LRLALLGIKVTIMHFVIVFALVFWLAESNTHPQETVRRALKHRNVDIPDITGENQKF